MLETSLSCVQLTSVRSLCIRWKHAWLVFVTPIDSTQSSSYVHTYVSLSRDVRVSWKTTVHRELCRSKWGSVGPTSRSFMFLKTRSFNTFLTPFDQVVGIRTRRLNADSGQRLKFAGHVRRKKKERWSLEEKFYKIENMDRTDNEESGFVGKTNRTRWFFTAYREHARLLIFARTNSRW